MQPTWLLVAVPSQLAELRTLIETQRTYMSRWALGDLPTYHHCRGTE
jgi:hypothetical protein